MAVQPIPDGYNTLTPYLISNNATEAIEFYKKALGAELVTSHPGPKGKVFHAELQVGDSRFMLADEFPDMNAVSAKTIGDCSVGFYLYVEDSDAAFKRAVDAGGTVLREMTDQFYGDRSGSVKDPYGYTWTFSTHVEDVSPEELARREKEQYGS